MFQPPYFREKRIEVMHALMIENPFATLVSSTTGGLTADHIPLVVHPELAEYGLIRGHLAAGNPLWRDSEGDIEVLAVFQGPHAYVTPSWYPSKKEHGKVVPTWNYAVVHAHGTLRFTKDPKWLLEHLSELTRRNESHRPSPWAVADAPDDYIDRQLKGIVGVEITINALSGKWKVSQNKTAQEREGVELGLLTESSSQSAAVSRLVRDSAK